MLAAVLRSVRESSFASTTSRRRNFLFVQLVGLEGRETEICNDAAALKRRLLKAVNATIRNEFLFGLFGFCRQRLFYSPPKREQANIYHLKLQDRICAGKLGLLANTSKLAD